jgi:UDP-glucose 4-epimerase
MVAEMHVANTNLTQRIGDISYAHDVQSAILMYKPTIVCIFACLKHIDLCEHQPEKAIAVNSQGIINVHNVLTSYTTAVKTVLYVSTDKACLPITAYGCSKALGEFYLQGVDATSGIKWVGIRYGNVLNSSGSIIPYLNTNGSSRDPYKLTHPEMTRFIMTLDQSANLVEYALIHAKHNEIIIPFIYSMKIADLFTLFEEKYSKTRIISGLRCKEKINEDLLSPIEAANTYMKNTYYHLTPNIVTDSVVKSFSSSDNIINCTELRKYLTDIGLY